MSRIKLSNNLFLDEYIPEALYRKYEKKPHILQGLLLKKMIDADQMLRDEFGSVTINNWWHGGSRNWSGIRTSESPYYSPGSQHSYAKASDKIFRNASADEVRKHIQQNQKELGITCIEANVSWVHSDFRWVSGNKLLIVYP